MQGFKRSEPAAADLAPGGPGGPGPAAAPDWQITDGLVPYPEALAEMDRVVSGILAGQMRERVWLLEHPPLYTAGTSARAADLLEPARLPVYRTGRGGQYTYHGPGQRVAYVMLDLKRRDPDLRRYVRRLEEWLILALAQFGVRGERRPGRIGIWVDRGGGREDKIAAIGVRVRRWVTFHGVSINVDPDLSQFDGIVPCGISGHGVTSLVDLGQLVTMPEVDGALRLAWDTVFDAGADPAPG